MHLWPARSLVGLSALLCACAPAMAPKATHVAPLHPAPTTIVAPQPDLSPVSEPAELIGIAHARNLASTLDAAGRLVQLPISLPSLVHQQLAQSGRDLLKLDASFDAAFLLDTASPIEDPKVLAAFSLPISSIEQTLAQLDKEGNEFVPIAPGVYRGQLRTQAMAPSRQQPDESDSPPSPLECDVAASVGDAPARLVCAETTNELDRIRPWLTRGMPLSQYGTSDLHAEVRLAPVQTTYAPVLQSRADLWSQQASQWLETEASVREPLLLRAPGQALQEAVRFVGDVDQLSFDVSLDPATQQISSTGRMRFRSRTSWLTQVITDTNDLAGPPPPLFWRAPRDSDTVTFARSADPKLYEGIRTVLLTAASTMLPAARVSERSRSATEAVISSFPIHDGPVVSAQGFIPPGVKQSPGKRTPSDAIADVRDLANQYVGWSLVGVEQPSSSYAAWLRKIGSLCQQLMRDARADKDLGPLLKKETWIPNIQIVERPAGMPRGTVALDFTFRFDSKLVWDIGRLGHDADASPHPAGPAAKGAITFRIAVVPDGAGRTWIASSTDQRALQSHLAAVMSGAPESGTIASLSELSSLRSERITSAGFFVYGRVLQKSMTTLRQSKDDPGLAAFEHLVASLPNRLMTPIVFVGRGSTGPAPVQEVEIRVLRGSLDDLSSLIAFAMTERGRSLLDSLGGHRP